MAWCPKCKMEYRDGVEFCADCKVPLVSSLEEIKVKLIGGNNEILEKLMEYLTYNDIHGCEIVENTNKSEDDDDYVLMIPEEYLQDAIKLQRNFLLQQMAEEGPEEEDEEELIVAAMTNEDDEALETKPVSTGIYQASCEKSIDHKFSAYTLLFVGIVGLVFLVLMDTGVFDIGLSTTSKYMITGVMGLLFVVFVIMGVLSMKSSKQFARKAENESNLSKEIKAWASLGLKAQQIDEKAAIADMDESEEVLYFARAQVIKDEINHKFMNLEEDFLEHLVDEIYQDIYDKKDEEVE